MHLKDIIEEGKKKILSGESLELAHIVRAEGSTPRSGDAYMLISSDASVTGSVGGGRVEYQASLYGAELLKEGKSGKRSYSLTRDDKTDAGHSKNNSGEQIKLGMICGGDVDIEFTYLPAMTDGERSRSLAVIEEIEMKAKNAESVVLIFGGGHVAESTAKLLDFAGFSYIIYDDREAFASKERFPKARDVICASYNEVLSHVSITEGSYVLIMTEGHHYDYEVQKQVLATRACFIGVIGSREKHRTINEKLKKDGFTDADLKRFFAPVGLQIAAETPEEIAVSITAELILVRAYREGRRKAATGRALKLETVRNGSC